MDYNQMFPSPCGEMIGKDVWLVRLDSSGLAFPSPCGEMIGKGGMVRNCVRLGVEVSIPLRGNDRKRLDSVTYTQQSLKSSFSTDMQIIADK